MSMTIGLSTDEADPELDVATVFDIDFNDDGYYWWLYPFFKQLAEQTGEMVDLYGDAIFGLPKIPDFRRMVAEARQRIESMPERWDVQTGILHGATIPSPVYSSVDRQSFLDLLNRLDCLIAKATRTGRSIVCLGD